MRPCLALVAVLVACHPASQTAAPASTTTPVATAEPAPTTTESSEQKFPAKGEPAPAFSLTAIDGSKITLAEAHAKGPVVVVFASFTCPPSRMKIPGFERLATKWQADATFFVVYSREAHPNARGYDRLSAFADAVAKMDHDGDNAVTLTEFEGPRDMFDPFDIDHDEVIRSHELLAARRLAKFETFEATTTDAQRLAAAKQFRKEVPGTIPVLLDPIGEPTAHAYGGMPNSAFVIAEDGTLAASMPWASVRAVEAALIEVTGRAAPDETYPTPNLEVLAPHLAASRRSGKPLLVQLTAMGCGACTRMHEETLQDADVIRDLAGFERVELGLDLDENWALFEALGLRTTPAFVVITADGAVKDHASGFADVSWFRAFLRRRR